jgi:hypothetical protein
MWLLFGAHPSSAQGQIQKHAKRRKARIFCIASAFIHKISSCQGDQKNSSNLFGAAREFHKCLILKDPIACIPVEHVVWGRIKSGFSTVKPGLHTKLSTEYVDSQKTSFATVI